jgi:Holliday junction DNA helicase RuvB
MAEEGKRKGYRERLIVGQETEEDVLVDLSLRPQTIRDFVGQKAVVENLMIAIHAARSRKEPLEHILLSGPPGLGKTTIAHIVARETETKITSTSGPAIERAGDMVGILTNLGEGDILFIDEVHRLSNVVEEFLYPAMENFQIDFVVDKGPYARTVKFNLKRFTLIGATTRTGLLTGALRGRFGIFHHLDFYPADDLTQIVKRSAKTLGIDIKDDGAIEIARRSRGTPRVANRLLRRVRDFAQVKSDGRITIDVAKSALEMLGIDEAGLDGVDRKVVKIILEFYGGGPVGIESIAAAMNEEQDTIVDVVEPFLLKIGFVKRTSRGREVTELGYKHFGFPYTHELQGGLFSSAEPAK